eukprot:7534427-Heterocapsa_arctica.AAC.1
MLYYHALQDDSLTTELSPKRNTHFNNVGVEYTTFKTMSCRADFYARGRGGPPSCIVWNTSLHHLEYRIYSQLVQNKPGQKARPAP